MQRRYLSAPGSIVEMERLFSLVSHFVDEKKKKKELTADNAETLLFVKKEPDQDHWMCCRLHLREICGSAVFDQENT